MDETHAAHVRGQLIHLVKGPSVGGPDRQLAVFLGAQVKNQEVVSRCPREFWMFLVDSAHPVSVPFEPFDQVAGNETGGTAYQCFFDFCLIYLPLLTDSVLRGVNE